jgi:hypothetical protein
MTHLDGVVESVDQATRTILLRTPDALTTIKVDRTVKNLSQVKAGDRVHIGLSEALMARVVVNGDLSAAPQITSSETTAAPGQKPGAIERESATVNVKITRVDVATNTVMFVDPSGEEHTARVRDPSMKALLRQLKPGDIVGLVYTVALARVVTPASP